MDDNLKTLETKKIKRVSPSQLSLFESCPRKWWALYVKKIKQPQPTKALALGSATHEVLELSLKGTLRGHPKWSDPNNLFDIIAQKHKLDHHELGMCKYLVANAKKLGWFDHTGRKVESEMSLCYKFEEVEINSRADRIDNWGDRVEVIDLKTGKTPITKDKVKSDWQARLYSLPFLQNGLNVKPSFWFLRMGEAGIIFDDFVPDDLEKIEDELRRLIEAMSNFDGSTCKKSWLCRFCPFERCCTMMENNLMNSFKS